jgi:hypothetical protein
MTMTPADIEQAIRDHPAEAEQALAAVQFGELSPLTVEILRLAVASPGNVLSLEALWVDQLSKKTKLDAFAESMRTSGAIVAGPAVVLPPLATDRFDPKEEARFLARAATSRCRVLVDDIVEGSGCLVGPSLVLTAWHVIALKPPAVAQPKRKIQVLLSDGTVLDALIPPRFSSFCGDAEYKGFAPKTDADVAGRNDVALLAMPVPAATHLGYAPLPKIAPDEATQRSLIITDYPNGADDGFARGRVVKIPKVTARWLHDAETKPGSSGAPCFNGRFDLAGLHQGKWQGGGRLVPLSLFLADLAPLVEQDLAPQGLWSLDGSVDGHLVIGRDPYIRAVAAAGDPTSRVRGVRIKRLDISAGSTGLAFSYEILTQLLARRATGHIAVRISFDEAIADLAADIRRRVVAAGLTLPEAATELGVAPGQAAMEGAAKDRAAVLAGALNAAAADKDATVWLFFDNPSVAIPESVRFAFEGFVSAALVQPKLRLVLAGFETVPLAGQEFATPFGAVGDGLPGFVVDYLGGFTRSDVLDFLTLASRDLTGNADAPIIANIADRVLVDLKPQLGDRFAQADLSKVTKALRPDLKQFQNQGRGG